MAEVEGGECVADVARRHRVQPSTLSWWRWRLRSERAAAPMLLPVVVRPPAPDMDTEATRIELRVRDVVLAFGSGADVTYVADLVEALRGPC